MSTAEECQQIDMFFSRIVQMIPSHLYTHSNSEDQLGQEDDESSRYIKHRKLPLSLDQRKAASKRKFDEKYKTTEESSIVKLPQATDLVSSASEPTSQDLEDLRKRLQARILGFKADRTSKKEPNDTDRSQKKKKKKKKNNLEKSTDSTANTIDGQSVGSIAKVDEADPPNGDVSAFGLGINSEITSLQYNKILDTNATSAVASKKQIVPQGNKMQRLKRLLDETEKKRERLQDLGRKSRAIKTTKNSTSENIDSAERAAKKLKSELWNDMLKVAAGDKGVIVPTKESHQKLKKAMKRIERKKRKSADKWAERIDKVKETKNAKIKKREDNLVKKKLKKNGGLIDSSKKPVESTHNNNNRTSQSYSTRPGFEGKKKGLLNH